MILYINTTNFSLINTVKCVFILYINTSLRLVKWKLLQEYCVYKSWQLENNSLITPLTGNKARRVNNVIEMGLTLKFQLCIRLEFRLQIQQ